MEWKTKNSNNKSHWTLGSGTSFFLALSLSLLHAVNSKDSQTSAMISNWKRQSYEKPLTSADLRIKDWFSKGCDSESLTPRLSKRVVRQEYRTLSWKQRYLFHACMKVMTETAAVLPYWKQNQYESFVTRHKFQFSPQAHGSPAFAPYHRALLYFFEKVMHGHPGCEGVGIPYWDSTLESYIPDPSMSAIFSGKTHLGNSRGKVEGKLYEKWVPIKIEACKYHGSELSRDMCRDPARMMNDTMIEKFVNCHNYTQCVFPLDKTFEENHGLIHGCVQGHMSELMCSPYDPIFWLHHAFIDLIFEDWLKKHYPDVHRDDPTQAYPSDDVIEEYYNKGSQPMRPFDKSGYKVKDGMSRNFTRDFYWYAPRPLHCKRDRDCVSRMIWCDEKEGRCKARVAEGGSCVGLPHKACYCRSRWTPNCSQPNSLCVCVDKRKTKPTPKSSRRTSFLLSSSPSSSFSSSHSLSQPQAFFDLVSHLDALVGKTPPQEVAKPSKKQKPQSHQTTATPQTHHPPPTSQATTTTPQTHQPPPHRPCIRDEDCWVDEWCDGVCRSKLPLGSECKTGLHKTCSSNSVYHKFTGTLSQCQKGIEEAKCLFNTCVCRPTPIECGVGSRQICPRNFFCSSRLHFCLPKARPKRKCDGSRPFEACGFCGQGLRGLCLKRLSRCYCVRMRTWFHLKFYW